MVAADCLWGARQVLKSGFAAVLICATAYTPAAGQVAANLPLRIALLVDTSAGTSDSITQLRAGLTAFADALPPEPEVLLVTTGRRTQVRVQPTADRKKLKDSANGLLSDGGPTPLMDSIVEIDERFLRKAADRRPVFVIVTGDGSESSVTSTGETFNAWMAKLPARHASVQALVIKSGTGVPEVVAGAMTRATGGSLQTINPRAPLVEALQKIAARISDLQGTH